MSGKNNGFSLKSMAATTPPVNPVEAMRKQLALGLMGGLTEKAMAEITSKLVEMAKAGDHKAMKMIIELTGVGKSPPAPAEPQGVKELAEAMQDIADELRIAREEASTQRKRKELAGPKDDEDDE